VSPRTGRREGEGAVLFIKDLRTYFYLPRRGRFVRAVEGVRLFVRQGETHVIVGESGSGKSVTVLSLMGLVTTPPGVIAGRIWYRPPGAAEPIDLLEGLDHFVRYETGPDVTIAKDNNGWLRWHERTMRDRRGRDFAMIFQNPRNALHPYFTVGAQLAEAVQRRGRSSKREALREAQEWLAKVHLDSPARRLGDYPHSLSGGMCQRVMVAMALAARPAVLIADEPTTGLDATIQSRVLDIMEEMKAELQTTTLVITHDMGVARRLADRVAVMYGGRVVEDGPAQTVLDPAAEPKHPYTHGLLLSIPTVDDIRARRPLQVIEGDVPDLSRLPSGCQFAPRCRLMPEGRERLCREQEPPLERAAEGHRVRCWRYLDPEQAGGAHA
jgi:oligopeptide/dipeptide ABC transporter ATP-binding protein